MSSSESDSDINEDQFEGEEEDDSDGSGNAGTEEECDDEDLPFPISVNTDESDDDDSDDDSEDASGDAPDDDPEDDSDEDSDEDVQINVKDLAKKHVNPPKKERQAALQRVVDEKPKKRVQDENPAAKVKDKKAKMETKAVESPKKAKEPKSKATRNPELLQADESNVKIPFERTKKDIKQTYEKRRGKSLCVRFPKRLPTEIGEILAMLKELCPQVLKVRRPRQPAARFCLADFHSQEDCRKAIKELRKAKVDGKKLQVQVPKTDSEDFLDELQKRRKKKLAENRARNKLKKSVEQTKEGETKKKIFTSTIMVKNIPIGASAEDIKSHFPEAMEFKLLYNKDTQETNSAVVTLPTPKDATAARRKRITIDEHKLTISFAGQSKLPKMKGGKTQNPAEGVAKRAAESEQKSEVNGKKQKKDKRKADALQKDTSPKKKIKIEKDSSPKKKIKVEKDTAAADDRKQFKIKKEIKTEPERQLATNKSKMGNDFSGNIKEEKMKKRQREDEDEELPALAKFKGTSGLYGKIENVSGSASSENKNAKKKKKKQNIGPGLKQFRGTGETEANVEEKFSLNRKDKPGKFSDEKNYNPSKFSNQGAFKRRGGPNRNQPDRGFQANRQKFSQNKGEFGGRKNFNKKGNFHAKSMRP